MRISWAGHVAGMVDVRKLLALRLENKNQLETVDLNLRILLKCLLVKECQGLWTGFVYFEVQVAGCCEHCHAPSVSLKCRKCLNRLETLAPKEQLEHVTVILFWLRKGS